MNLPILRKRLAVVAKFKKFMAVQQLRKTAIYKITI
jgi:hypothetical protein